VEGSWPNFFKEIIDGDCPEFVEPFLDQKQQITGDVLHFSYDRTSS